MKRLDPKIDVVFKLLFTRNEALLRSMLSAVLALRSPIQHVTVLNPEIKGDLPGDKLICLDIRLRLDDGREVDVEMQCRSETGLRSRIVFYCCRLHAGDLGRGEDYTKVHPTISIVWLDDVLLKSEQFHSVFHLAEDVTGERFSEDLEIHMLELPKLSNCPPAGQLLLHRWARFLRARGDEELQALAKEDSIMAEAKSTLDSLSGQPDVQALAYERQLALEKYWYGLGAARAEGRAEGKAEGKAEGEVLGRVRDVIAVLETRGLPPTPEQRSRIEQIADPGQLDRLVRKAVTVDTVDALFGE